MKIVRYKTTILKFKKHGEKTGWTYIVIPVDIAAKLYPGNKKSFRVKGKLDDFEISGIALIPMGKGEFIMPLNAQLRKGIGKRDGAILMVSLQRDDSERVLDKEFMECLAEDPDALAYFNSLPGSHQNYFSKWIASAKSEETKARRIARSLNALSKNMGYPEMLRAEKQARKALE
ncbi:MAG: YdeI/OmpD-associated family protein [Bacteroidia bacterium]